MSNTQYLSIKSGTYGRHKINFIYAVFKDTERNTSVNNTHFPTPNIFLFEHFSLACNLYKTINPKFNGLSIYDVRDAIRNLKSNFNAQELVSNIYIFEIYEVLKLPSYDFMNVVILDPGHGGKDPGAVWDKNHTEYMVVSDIADKLKNKILLDSETNSIPLNSLEIMYPSGVPSDVKPSLSERVLGPRKYAIDSNLKPKFFISLHCNASASIVPTGASVHYKVRYPDKMGNKEFAKIIYDEYILQVPELIGNRSSPLVDEGNRLTVLNTAFNSGVPGVLIELGFISNEEDKILLFDLTIREKIVTGLYNGLKRIIFGY